MTGAWPLVALALGMGALAVAAGWSGAPAAMGLAFAAILAVLGAIAIAAGDE